MRQSKKCKSRRMGMIEQLERRTMLSVTLDAGVLNLVGTDGNDTASITANAGVLTVNFEGVRTFSQSAVSKIVFLGYAGDDRFELQKDVAIPVEARGGQGHDTLITGAGQDTVYGGQQGDYIQGGPGADYLRGSRGLDRILGNGGNDTIYGGLGSDTINSGAGDDFVDPGVGDIIDSGVASLYMPMNSARYQPDAYLSNVIGYDPMQIRRAYGLGAGESLATYYGRGAGQTIYIVDAFSGADPFGDLYHFSQQFSLPLPDSNTFQVVTQSGFTPARDQGWSLEQNLDLQWAHAIAPGAKLVLVQADSNMDYDMLAATQLAGQLASANGGVVSMSFGRAGGLPNQVAWDELFRAYPNVSFLAASGDGALTFPATSPYVTSVGGTTLQLDSVGNLTSEETAWEFGGAGFDAGYTRPGYQDGIDFGNGVGLANVRGCPDVSMNADPNTPYAVFTSTSFQGDSGWFAVGGTSASTPEWAALVAIANQKRAEQGKAAIGNRLNGILYDLYQEGVGNDNGTSAVRDIIRGTALGFQAGIGYDLATGLGVPNGDFLINQLTTFTPFFLQSSFSFDATLNIPGDTPSSGLPPITAPQVGQERSGFGYISGGDLLQLQFITNQTSRWNDPNNRALLDQYYDIDETEVSLQYVYLHRSGRGQSSGTIYGFGEAVVRNTNDGFQLGALLTPEGASLNTANFTLKFQGTWSTNADGSIAYYVDFGAVDPVTHEPLESAPFSLTYSIFQASRGAYFSGSLQSN